MSKTAFWIHIGTITLFALSPFLFNWKLILLGVFLFYIQLLTFGNCILTLWQFGPENKGEIFYHHLFRRLGFNFSKKKVHFVITYIKPWLLFIIALIWQINLGYTPVIL